MDCNFWTIKQWLNNEHNCDALCYIEHWMPHVPLRITIDFTMFYHIAYTWIKDKLICKTFHNVVYCIHWHFTLIIIRKKHWLNRLPQKLLSFQCWPIGGSTKCILYNTEPNIWTRYRLQNCFSTEVIMFLDIYLIRIDGVEYTSLNFTQSDV